MGPRAGQKTMLQCIDLSTSSIFGANDAVSASLLYCSIMCVFTDHWNDLGQTGIILIDEPCNLIEKPKDVTQSPWSWSLCAKCRLLFLGQGGAVQVEILDDYVLFVISADYVALEFHCVIISCFMLWQRSWCLIWGSQRSQRAADNYLKWLQSFQSVARRVFTCSLSWTNFFIARLK